MRIPLIKSNRNKVGFIILSLILLVLAIALHVLYSSRLNTYHFNASRLYGHMEAGDDAFSREDFAAAETHYKAALKEAEKKSPENIYIRYALLQLMGTYIVLMRFEDAEATVQREVAVTEKVYGPESPEAEATRSRAESVRKMRKLYRQLETNQKEMEAIRRELETRLRGSEQNKEK